MAKEESLARAAPKEGEKALLVRRGRVESVDLYEIKDSELDLLERGNSVDLQLNFAIFLISTAFSAIGSLATATFTNPRVENAFLFVSIAGILGGFYLLVAWWMGRKSLKEVCARIRERIPPDVIAAAPVVDSEDDEEGGEGEPAEESPSPK